MREGLSVKLSYRSPRSRVAQANLVPIYGPSLDYRVSKMAEHANRPKYKLNQYRSRVTLAKKMISYYLYGPFVSDDPKAFRHAAFVARNIEVHGGRANALIRRGSALGLTERLH
jgi:hypothetical protein